VANPKSRETVQDAAAARLVESALRTLSTEMAGVQALAAALGSGLGGPFTAAIEKIRAGNGRVIVTGMGKSGHVARKIAATLSSTGTPSYYVHPAEASHGDLGMIARDDIILALSWSGETAELRNVIDYAKRFRVPLIAITSKTDSSLARAADIPLILPSSPEACPNGLAPTTSTLMQLALGDALAVALLESRGFTALDFKALHPGGKLGASLTFVKDVMHGKENMPIVPEQTPMREAVNVMTAKGYGCVGVLDGAGQLTGIITDGDLRRHMDGNLMKMNVNEVMTKNPKTVNPETLAGEALAFMNASKINALFVVEGRKPVGLLRIHELLRIGVA
jgi:arabinose-5-phosphate isomerase